MNLVNGGAETVNALLDHPAIAGGHLRRLDRRWRATSTPARRPAASACRPRAARRIRSSSCRTPTCELTTSIVTDSAFGNAGQRCLAASLAITVGEADRIFTPALAEAAASRVVGYGLDAGVQMGPVITPQSKARIAGLDPERAG